MEICRSFDQIFKEHLDGVYVSPFCTFIYFKIVHCLYPFCFLIILVLHSFSQTNNNNLLIPYRRPGGDKIYNVFDNQLPAALKRLQFDKQLSMENIRKRITEADGYQPHLIAPEQGYRHLIESSLTTIRGPAEAAVDVVCINDMKIIVSKHGSVTLLQLVFFILQLTKQNLLKYYFIIFT